MKVLFLSFFGLFSLSHSVYAADDSKDVRQLLKLGAQNFQDFLNAKLPISTNPYYFGNPSAKVSVTHERPSFSRMKRPKDSDGFYQTFLNVKLRYTDAQGVRQNTLLGPYEITEYLWEDYSSDPSSINDDFVEKIYFGIDGVLGWLREHEYLSSDYKSPTIPRYFGDFADWILENQSPASIAPQYSDAPELNTREKIYLYVEEFLDAYLARLDHASPPLSLQFSRKQFLHKVERMRYVRHFGIDFQHVLALEFYEQHPSSRVLTVDIRFTADEINRARDQGVIRTLVISKLINRIQEIATINPSKRVILGLDQKDLWSPSLGSCESVFEL